jgi:hypothetical protein
VSIVPGLCSVTFRSLDIETVAAVGASAGLRAIEWGGDVHVPPGDMASARRARVACDDLGLAATSYGSYLAAGRIDDHGDIGATLDTACELGATNVRVWAHGPSAAADLGRICGEADGRGLTVSLEFHPGTRTESAASANALLHEVGHGRLRTYWQPDPSLDAPAALAELADVIPRLSDLHVFWWKPDYSRLPLEAGAALWPAALRLAEDVARVAYLEFVRDDDPEQLRADAETLRSWLQEDR